MIELVVWVLAGLGVLASYVKTRSFVRERLRFVDAVYRPVAPVVAGGAAALAAAPLAWVAPFIGGGTALLFGAAVGYGVVRGRRDLEQLPPG